MKIITTPWNPKKSDFTLVASLKDCSKKKDLHKGTQIHEDILKTKNDGLLQKNPYLASALINMYAKCGKLKKAQEVHDLLHVRRTVSWNALISGYVQHGQTHRAFDSFEQMQGEGLSPDPVTYICMLKACGKVVAINKGKEIHEDIVRKGMLKRNIVLGTALVDMYAKCDAITKAQQVHDELDARNVVSWSALISGYVRVGHYHEALDCFERMQTEDDLSPNAATFTSIIKACAELGTIEKGSRIYEEVSKRGLLEKSTVVGNALIDMYAKFGMLDKSWNVFEKLYSRDVVSWSTLIDGYVQQSKGHEALNCYEQMQHEGLSMDATAFTCILKACGGTGSIEIGKQVHEKIVNAGFLQNNVIVGSAVVDMYIKCGMLAKAQEVLERLPNRNVVSWSALIAGYVQQGHNHEAIYCFECMRNDGLLPDAVTFSCILKACGSMGAIEMGKEIHDEIMNRNLLETDVVLASCLVDMYARCGVLVKAYQVLEELPLRNVVSWSALISGYAQHGKDKEALNCFEYMQLVGFSPDVVTFIGILKSCGNIGALDRGKEIHVEVVKERLHNNVLIGTALVDMYAKCDALVQAQRVFDQLQSRTAVCWNSLITGYAHWGHGQEALNCFEQMQRDGVSADMVTFLSALKACGSIGELEKGKEMHAKIIEQGILGEETLIANAIVDMYGKCGAVAKAQEVFDELDVWTIVSWNALIAGYAQHGLGEEAMKCYERMLNKGFSPNALTFASILKACGCIGAIDKGKEIHADVMKEQLQKDLLVGNALVDMYAKCGAPTKAQQVFDELPMRDVVSWTVLIAGYAQVGHDDIVIDLFNKMIGESINPDLITCTIVLNACSHSGQLDKGEMYFKAMYSSYGIASTLHLCTCIVDMFGRAGQFSKIVLVIEKMPTSDYLPTLTTLLGACHKWGNVELGRLAFEHIVQLDEKHCSAYVLMSNIYVSVDMLEEAKTIETLRVKNKAWENPECCWTDFGGEGLLHSL